MIALWYKHKVIYTKLSKSKAKLNKVLQDKGTQHTVELYHNMLF